MTPVSFSLLPFGGFFFFVFRAAELAIYLPLRLAIEWPAAAFTLFHLAATDFGVEIKVCRQHTPQKIVAVNAAAGDELHTSVLISVVQQQTVAVSVVAAKSPYKPIDPFGLFR